MAEKSFGEQVLERMEQIDAEYMESMREVEVTTVEGTGRLKPADYESYKAWFLMQYPPRYLQMPDAIVFDSPAVVLLRDYPERIANRAGIWPDIKKALGIS